MPRVTVPVIIFGGMAPQKGSHLLRVDPQSGAVELLENVNIDPRALPILQTRLVERPIQEDVVANIDMPLRARN